MERRCGMLKKVVESDPHRPEMDFSGIAPLFRLADVLAALRRQWPTLVTVLAAFVALALVYVLVASARYTAVSTVMLNTRKTQLVQQQAVVGDLQIDPGVMDSQVELLKSESVALKVIRDLRLTEDPEFTGPGRLSKLSGGLLRALGLGENRTEAQADAERLAVQQFDKNLRIKRVGTSYVMEVSFTADVAAKAARIANAVVDAYMVGELDARFDATKRASHWLQERINELRVQATDADAAVQRFKAANNIVDTGRGLLGDQQLGDTNAQIIAARGAVAEAKARLDRIEQTLNQEVPDAVTTETLRSDVITRLRAQYLDISARESEYARRFGANHQSVVLLRNQAQEIGRAIAEEVRRIAQTTRSDYEVAQARLTALESSLEQLIGQSAVTGEAQVKLRSLESAAQTYRNLYDTFLQRFMETAQQQSFAIDEARVITVAAEPTEKSWPRPLLTLAAALVLGGLAGAGAAVGREALDDRFRTLGQVEDATGLTCIGILPLIPALPRLPGARPADAAHRRLASDLGVMRYAVQKPFSRFAETIRAAKVAIDIRGLSKETKVVGIVSALPREGKSTVASNLAQTIAHAGLKVVLLDGDLRNPSLTRLLAPGAERGLIEILRDGLDERELLWSDPVTGLEVLPAVMPAAMPHTAELLSSRAMGDLLQRLRARYDYVIVDLPPAAPVVDVRAAGNLIDGFLLVVEWGRTHKSAVIEALTADRRLHARTIGVLLGKADRAALRRLESYKGAHYDAYYSDVREPA